MRNSSSRWSGEGCFWRCGEGLRGLFFSRTGMSSRRRQAKDGVAPSQKEVGGGGDWGVGEVETGVSEGVKTGVSEEVETGVSEEVETGVLEEVEETEVV